MFRITGRNISFPERYPRLKRIKPTSIEKGCTKVGDYTLRDNLVDLAPQAGLQEQLCACDCNLVFICGEATSGKAQPYTSKVLTPDGFVEMGSLKVGDTILAPDGSTQQVLKIFEQGEIDVWRLTFDDGASTECCANHLWKVQYKTAHNNYKPYKIDRFEDVLNKFNKGYKVAVPFCSKINFNQREELPIPPYVLGQKLANAKFVPEIYKYTSAKTRLELLQGLIDTDGTVDQYGHIAYYTVSEQLAADIQWIVRSLGGRCSITTKHPQIDDRRFCCAIDIDGFRRGKGTLRHILKHCEYVGKKKCRCIMVSGDDHLYVTDDFIVTHNTFSMYLKALQGVQRYGFTAKLISFRLQDSKKGGSIFRDGVTVCGNFANCEYAASDYPSFTWSQWNSSLQLIHSNFNADNPSEWEAFQDYAKKVQASLIMIDEATEIKWFKMFAYWFSRNRDSSGMPPQMILSFNPSHDHWTTQMLVDAGYIGDNWYLRKDMVGKVRYWYNKGNSPTEIVWGDTREEVADAAGLVDREVDLAAGISRLDYIKSFTVFTGAAADNRELVHATGGQSVANLHAVGAEQRQVVGMGYFGEIDNAVANVSRELVNNLWTNPTSADETMYATMDISSGKAENDKSPMIIWRGTQIVAVELFSGEPTSIASWIQNRLKTYGVDVTHFAYDATGHGYWMQGLTNGVPVTANKRAIQEYDEYGNAVTRDEYFNCRSQLIGKTEVLFKRGDISCAVSADLTLPYGKNGTNRRFRDILYDEINIFISTTRNKRIYYKSKDEYRAKFRHSPDLMDAICLIAVFFLDARPKKTPSAHTSSNSYDGLYQALGQPFSRNWGKKSYDKFRR